MNAFEKNIFNCYEVCVSSWPSCLTWMSSLFTRLRFDSSKAIIADLTKHPILLILPLFLTSLLTAFYNLHYTLLFCFDGIGIILVVWCYLDLEKEESTLTWLIVTVKEAPTLRKLRPCKLPWFRSILTTYQDIN